MTFAPRTLLGPYEILAPLGAGAMGEVYRARDTRLGRHVAVKVIARSLVQDPRRVKRFELEARATSTLNHPNIISIFDIGSHGDTRFVVMELVEGRTLGDVLKQGPLTVMQAIGYAAQVADALHAAHHKGIIHRDLKPGNLMVTTDGRVKVLDFGLAKLVARDGDGDAAANRSLDESTMTEASTVMEGTLPYMAPEQIRGEAVDARTDLFALGVVLYEMITGFRPFAGKTVADVASAILRDHPVPPHAVRNDLPADLDRLIRRSLEKDPAHRYPAAREVSDELKRAIRLMEANPSWSSDSYLAPAPGTLTDTSLKAPEVPSIAVLPFVNRSMDEEDEYFSDGLADELLNVLAKIKGLRVVGRTSSYQFKGRTEDLRVIGRKLNVATLLEGSVRKTANRVRIAVELVKVSDGFQLWSQSYDRTLEDIFAVQDDIAQCVVKELRTTLLGENPDSSALREAARADVAVAVRGRGESSEAYRLFLKGRYFVNRSTREDVMRGLGYLLEAVQTDPDFALGWAELSGAYAIEAGYGWFPVDAGNERARRAAERALSLEPDLAEGHVRLGAVQMNYDRNWRAAEASFQRALAAAPGNAFVLRLAGNLASNLGRLDEAIDLYRRAIEQDPLSSAGYQGLAISCHAAGLPAEAEKAYRTSIELAPQRIGARYGLGLVLLEQGRHEEARAEALQEPEEVFRLLSLAIILFDTGHHAESEQTLQELIGKYAEGGAYQIAEVYAARGDADAAFEWLERAYAQHDGGISEMKSEPMFRMLHADPRWNAFLRRVGLA